MLGLARIAAARASLRYRGVAPTAAPRRSVSRSTEAAREDIAKAGDSAAGREKIERREWRERMDGGPEAATPERLQTQLKKERDKSWKEDIYE